MCQLTRDASLESIGIIRPMCSEAKCFLTTVSIKHQHVFVPSCFHSYCSSLFPFQVRQADADSIWGDESGGGGGGSGATLSTASSSSSSASLSLSSLTSSIASAPPQRWRCPKGHEKSSTVASIWSSAQFERVEAGNSAMFWASFGNDFVMSLIGQTVPHATHHPVLAHAFCWCFSRFSAVSIVLVLLWIARVGRVVRGQSA
jgi:hypothetical protein